MSELSGGVEAPPPPGLSTFDTRALSGADAFELWRGRGEVSAAQMTDIVGDASNFWCESKMLHFGRVALVDVQMTPLTFDRTAERARKDGVNHIWLEWNRSSADNRLEMADVELVTGAGSIHACDMSVSYTRRVFDSNCIGLYLDRSLLSNQELQVLTRAVIGGARARMLGNYMTGLLSAAASKKSRVEQTTAAVVVATVAGSADRAHEAATALGPLALIEARRFIDKNLSRESVSMAEVVAATGVSRATLYRLFQPYGGLARFMWSHRLERARMAISSPKEHRTLDEIATHFGFSSHGNFTRAFRHEFGVRPSDLRPFYR